MIKDKDLMNIQCQLWGNHYEMMLCDRDKKWDACRYGYERNMFNPMESEKVLKETLNYIKVYHKDIYLGIAHKSDSRFDSKGQLIPSMILPLE